VTTNHAAISRPAPARASLSIIVLVATLGLVGCESSSTLLGNANGSQPETQLSQPKQAAPAAQSPTKVAIAPIIGAPDSVAKQLQQDFGAAVAQQKVSVVASGDRSDFTLRGYIVAAKDRAGTKVSYIWDVTDPAGKRVNRITGEELIAATAGGKDPWSAVTPQVTQGIAQKSAASFGAWLPNAQSQAAVAAGPQAQPVGVGAQPSGGAAQQQAIAQPAAARGQNAIVTPTTASITSDLAAIVPNVAGAPGDGGTSLTQAIQNELTRSGVALSNQPTASTYRVEGVVKVGQARDGKQPIQIDWNVKDPQGKKVGTVSQKNEIPEGSLDGAWGKTADAAAAAAAQGILKLLPGKNASN
jgi:hypothetical protein